MGLFANPYGDQNNEQFKINVLLSQYKVARNEILMALVFTAINIVLLLINGINSGVAFLFSITVPYYCVGYGIAFTDEFGSAVFLASGIIAALIIIGLYVMFFILSKERPGCLTALFVMFAIDSLAITVLMVFTGSFAGAIFDILIHALILYYLSRGVTAAAKLKKLGIEVNHPYFIAPVAQNNENAERNAPGAAYYTETEEKEESGNEERPEKPEPIYRTEPAYEWDGEGKTRLSAEHNGSEIRVIRKFSCTALIIDNNVYDTYDRIIETDYCLAAEVNGVRYVYEQNSYGAASLSANGTVLASGTLTF